MFIKLSVTPELYRKKPRNPVIINVENISSIDGSIVKMNNCDILHLDDLSLRSLLLSISPKAKKTTNDEPKQELLELFEELHKLTGGKGKTVFSLQREKKLGDLLTKHRLTKENLITAATNIGKDEFLQGDNENKKRYGDIDYLLRPDKAAKWSEEQAEKRKRMF